MTPILETDRLVLRPVALTDAPMMQQYVNNWNVVKYLSLRLPWPYPDDGAETFLRDICLPSVEAGKQFVWAITLKDDPEGKFVGIIDYRFEPDDHGERGFWLAEHLWGQGLMSEAVTAMQDYMFFDYGLESIAACNATDNIASSRLKQKYNAEFIEEIELECHAGKVPAEKWRITREGWATFRGRPLADLPVCRSGDLQ